MLGCVECEGVKVCGCFECEGVRCEGVWSVRV